MTETPDEDITGPVPPEDELSETIKRYSEAYDVLCLERHEKGQREYGNFTFLGNDVIRMMMEELADTSNYCRMQFIKLMMLQHQLEEQLGKDQSTMGGAAFKGVGEVEWSSRS